MYTLFSSAIVRSLLFMAVALSASISVSASHISGANISYECLGGDDYLITVNLFRDCQDLNYLPAQLNVFIGSTCWNVGYEAFPQVDLVEVSQLCDAQLPYSTCNGGFLPGTQMGVYQKIIELEPCIDWRIVISEQNRDGEIVNLTDPELFSVHTYAFLNNTSPVCNSSPTLSLLNLPYICVGTPLYYNLGFMDGDSLSYALISALSSETPNLPVEMDYTGLYSGAEPMTGMTIDPATGQISVIPNQLGKFNTVVEVREYRNGNLIGIVHYDFLFQVNACAIPPPAPDLNTFVNVSGGGYPIDHNTVGICSDDDFCFEIGFTSTDPSINVQLHSNLDHLIPGVAETVTGTNPATIRFCGSLPPDFTGGSFIITAIDDVCPVNGQNFYTIDFTFRQPLQAIEDTVICFGESVELTSLNDTVYTWYSLSGNVLSAPGDISCNPCQSPVVSPDSSTYYIVEGLYANSTCNNIDTVLVTIPLSTNAVFYDETCTGNDGIIDIEILTGSGNYDVIWDDIGEGPLLRNDLVAGTYSVVIYDNDWGCSRTDIFNLEQLSSPIANAGNDFEICGLSANLAAIPSFGVPSWNEMPGVTYSDLADENATVTVSNEGTYTFVWTENVEMGCQESDSVNVTFYAQPTAEIVSADSVCGLQLDVEAIVPTGVSEWSATSGVIFDDPLSQNTGLQAGTYGSTTLYLHVENGLCTTADTAEVVFIQQPIANAGADIDICGNEAEISGIDGIGTNTWILPAAISTSQLLTDPTISVISNLYGSFEIVRTVTNQDFCTDTDTTTVLLTEIPIVDLGADHSVCDSTTTVNFAIPIGDLTWELSPNLSSITTVDSPQQIVGNFGNHQAILHADNGYGCTNSDTLNLNFVIQPKFASSVIDTACGLTYEFNADIIAENHFWLSPNGVVIADSTDPNSSATVSSQGDYTFNWVAENGGFCRDTTDFTITFYDQPQSDAGDDVVVCGLSTSLSATASYGQFLWQDQPGLTFSNPLSPNSLLASGTDGAYAVSLIETNGICTDTDTVEIQFLSTPQISNVQWECTGSDAEFIVSFDVSLGDTAHYEVQGLQGVLSDFHFTSFPLPSDTPVELIFHDNGFCGGDTLTGTKFCPILTYAGVMAADTLRFCGSDFVETPAATGSILDGNDTLLYAFHDGSADVLGTVFDWNNSPEFAFSESLDYNETYFISAVAGNEINGQIDLNDPLLSVSTGTPVEFYALPFGEISGNWDVCPYDTVLIPVNLEGAMPQELTYSVSGESYSVFADESNFTIAIADSGEVNLISTNSQYCTGSVSGSASISYYRLPEASFSGPPTICDGDEALMEITFEGVAPFSGNIVQDGSLVQSINSSTDSLGFLANTEGYFSLINFSDQNCTASDTAGFWLTVKPLPVVSAGDDLNICTGDTAMIGGNFIPGQQYAWQPHAELLANNMAEVQFAAHSNSPFPQPTIAVVVAELDGCFKADSVTITVYPIPIPQIIGPASACSGDSITLIAYGADTYIWSPAQYFANPTDGVSKFLAPANTEIELTATSIIGCEATITTELEILETPSAAFGVSEMSGCAPLDVELFALSGNSADSYAWHLSRHNDIPNSGSVTATLAEAGTYSLSLTVTSPNGCSKTEELPENIEVFSTSAAFKYSPEKPSVTKPEVFFTNLSPSGVSSQWAVDSLIFSQNRNAAYTFPELTGGSYGVCLTVTDSNSCTAKYCDQIKIDNDFNIYVPTAFTPDGDGLNDLFYPVLSNIAVTEYKFWITNSRGEVVFSTTNLNAKWNGGSKDSNYFGENKIYNWHIIAKPEHNVETTYYTGSVMLIR